MKNMKKIVLSLLCTFVSISIVNAEFTCEVNIRETEIEPTGYHVVMPICEWVRDPDTPFVEITTPGLGDDVLDRKPTYSEAYDSGLEMTDIYYSTESADGKSIYEESARVPYCADSNRKVRAYATCTAYKSIQNVSCTSINNATSCGNHSGCTWVMNPGTNDYICAGVTPVCPEGYSNPNWSTYKCSASFAYEQDVTGNVNPAVSACPAGATCTCSTVEYGLLCPNYRCNTVNTEVSACAPSFEVEGQDAYCVNPSQGFPTSEDENYQHDTSFNVRECANSYSTADCGYANILIEGAFHENVSDESINLALRLWSYHVNQTGFDKTGLANREGATCSNPVYYMTDADGHKINVYAKTHKYIMEHILESTGKSFYQEALTYEYIPTYLENPETNRSAMNGTTFEKITCRLTDEMQGVVCGDDARYRVGIELYFNTLIGNKYMQTHLDNLYNDSETAVPTGVVLVPLSELAPHLTEEELQALSEVSEGQWALIKYEREDFERAFGDQEVIDCDPNDPDYEKIKKYCKPTITVYDENGNDITGNDEEIAKCIKKIGCIQKTKVIALCTPVQTGYRVDYVEAKYTMPRSSLSVRKFVPCGGVEDNQIMFSYFPDKTDGDYEERPDGFVRYYPSKICDDSCTNYDLRIEGGNACNKDDNHYDTSYSKKISDPSLGCIVNMTSDSEKNYYDFSEKFGVNTNFCRIYCSDQITYYLADKTSQSSGKSFVYDVRDNKSAYDVSYKFSAVVKERRSCLSEIFFDNLPKDVDWKAAYGLTNSEENELRSNLTWTKLFNIVKNKDYNNTNRVNRIENLNQLVYDLYNCNLYAQNKFDANHLYKPQNNTVGNVFNNIKTIFGSSNGDGYTNKDDFNDTVTFDIGSSVAEYNSQNETVVGQVGKGEYAVNTEKKYNDNSTNFGISRVKYCSSLPCVTYSENEEDYSYNAFTNNSVEADETMNGYRIPTNLYAYFEINHEVNFYNPDTYQILPNTGNVTKNTHHEGLYDLPGYHYPISKHSFNNDTCIAGGDSDHKLCPITQTVNISTYVRATGMDRLQTEVSNNTQFVCYVKVDAAADGDFRFIDLNTPFPNGRSETLWDNEVGAAAEEQIINTADMLQTSDELLEYRITLNPEQIQALKGYNSSKGPYLNEAIHDCEIHEEGNRIYTGCKSELLDSLRSGDTYGTIDPNYRDGLSKYNAERSGN